MLRALTVVLVMIFCLTAVASPMRLDPGRCTCTITWNSLKAPSEIRLFEQTNLDGKGVFIDRSLTAAVSSTSPGATPQSIKDACLPGTISFTVEYLKPNGSGLCTGNAPGAATQTELIQAHDFRFKPGEMPHFSTTVEKGKDVFGPLFCKDALGEFILLADLEKEWGFVQVGGKGITCSVTATLTLKDGAVCVTPEPLTITLTKTK